MSSYARAHEYDLDSGDANIVADFGIISKEVIVLAAGTGPVVFTPATQRPGQTTESFSVLPPAGTRIKWELTKIAKGTSAGVKLLVLACFALLLAGCAGARDAAVATLNASADFAKSAEPALEDLDRRDQQAVIDATKTRDDAVAQLAPVRARYKVAWTAYRDYRASWLAAAAAVRVYDDASRAKLTKSEADFATAVADLVAAEGALATAISVIRQGGKLAPAKAPPAPAPSSAPAATAPPKGGAS